MSNQPPNRQTPSDQFPMEEQPWHKRKGVPDDQGTNILDDIAIEVSDGCLAVVFKLIVRVITLPFRLIWNLIENIFD